jgi:hypothetical protein
MQTRAPTDSTSPVFTVQDGPLAEVAEKPAVAADRFQALFTSEAAHWPSNRRATQSALRHLHPCIGLIPVESGDT